jgi:hypothetical protein
VPELRRRLQPAPDPSCNDWRNGNWLGAYPASAKPRHRPVDLAQHAELLARLRDIDPARR